MQKTQRIFVGSLPMGGGAPVTVQSMTNTPTADVAATLQQIAALKAAGCDIVRLAVSDEREVRACRSILPQAGLPLVADIQFDWKVAVACSDIGFDKVRFNPGNIGSEQHVEEVVRACKANGTPIRVGVNSGSIQSELLLRYGKTPQALVESALSHVAILERHGFSAIVVSVKSSDVRQMIEAYRLLSKQCSYPLHVGVTESGAREEGLVKSAMGIGSLLCDGIGDTIRVSLTGDPVQEVEAAKLILDGLQLRPHCEVIACPTCSRCKIDLLPIVDAVRARTKQLNRKLKIAVMGCVVNGPGEAQDADFGIAGGKDKAVLFVKGKVVKTIPVAAILPELERLIQEYEA